MFDKVSGFLSRLGKDTRGNVVAMAAAMIIPMIGLVGGAVDMSRLYATKTRLQAACDAGALAGRRTMAAGQWNANSNRADTQAKQVFDLNFASGAFGSQNKTRSFAESGGTVTGTASAQVPMTLMRVMGIPTSTISVTCTSMMVIPNTDVMFVLDTTGSMNCEVARAGYSCSDNGGVEAAQAKMKGLRTAVKCFYEALSRLDTTEDCGTVPTGGLSSAVQLRFGFMPYSTNVNVGKLLPNDFFADRWTYQSRNYVTAKQWGYTLGSESSKSWGAYSQPADAWDQSKYSNWTEMATGSNVTIDGTGYARRPNTTTIDTSGKCTALNVAAGNTMIGFIVNSTTNNDSGVLQSTTPQAPIYNAASPPSQQILSYAQDADRSATGYKYVWSNSGKCRMWSSNQRTYDSTRYATSSKTITWAEYDRVTSYTYQPLELDISALKAGGNSWNSSLLLPVLTKQTGSIRLSGQPSATGTTKLNIPDTTTAIAWNGCIEDAKEPRNTDGTPAGEWSPIPSNAFAAQIDLVPTSGNPDTLWAPVLTNAVWGRYDYDDQNGDGDDEYRYGNYTTPTNFPSRNISSTCPTEARKLQSWPTPANFVSYVDSLDPGGNTYHDIGLVWGGRFASPDGIFASENRTTPQGASIMRHMIFMTDGDTATTTTNYTSQGVAWWDRRQTNTSSAPSTTLLTNVVNARFSAICEAIKNKQIILWVVSYGGGVNATTETRLENCASSGRYYSASDTPTLIANFQDIANKIAALRLTN